MAKASKKVTKKPANPPVKKSIPVKKTAPKKETAKEVVPDPVKEEVAEKTIQPEPIEEKSVDCPEEDPVGETEFSEFTIKEIMVQKNVDRPRAIEILRNPTK